MLRDKRLLQVIYTNISEKKKWEKKKKGTFDGKHFRIEISENDIKFGIIFNYVFHTQSGIILISFFFFSLPNI